MTRFATDALSFRHDLVGGFARAYARYVEKVPGTSGVITTGGPHVGKVAVVIGGGSGHYPAFCGLVGAGLADAAVIGDVFTSPSAEQAYRTARAVDGDAGVIFSFGNYAGDVLNFAAAERRLRVDGIDCRTVLVTDDVASAPVHEAAKRRGIAGTLVVFKAAGAAAARGAAIDEVERTACKANARTRTIGVAFAPCTLPGRDQPLFEMKPGTFEIGMGIHGEPGVRTVDALTPVQLAHMMVESLIEERPLDSGPRTAVVLNGLGTTKYEELFVLWEHLVPAFDRAGLDVVLPEVGEFVTSLDMAGCSLTMTWLDDELTELWAAPADSPAFRRAGPASAPAWERRRNPPAEAEAAAATQQAATESSRHAARVARAMLRAMLHAVEDQEDELGRLDAIAGDGDHGSGMVRGLLAATRAAQGGTGGVGSTLRTAGRAFADQAGGTSGVLWGIILEATGEELGDGDPAPDAVRIAEALRHAIGEVARIGGAGVGDKTLLDSAIPFLDVLQHEVGKGRSLAPAWADAARAATDAAAGTARLVPRVGRARPLAERSLGHPDAGAVSLAVCVTAIDRLLSRDQPQRKADA
jgi:dihydroxyacetone kinase